MTIAELLQAFEAPDPPARDSEKWEQMKEALTSVLYVAACFYDDNDYDEHDDACHFALLTATTLVEAEILDNEVAKNVIKNFAGLASSILDMYEGTDYWNADTLAKLEAIKTLGVDPTRRDVRQTST